MVLSYSLVTNASKRCRESDDLSISTSYETCGSAGIGRQARLRI